MPALRTYPIRIQKFYDDDDVEMLIIDVLIDGKRKHLVLDTGAQDNLVLFEPATKPGCSLTKRGLMMDFSGTAQKVRMQIGPITTTPEALFLSQQQCNNKNIIDFKKSNISGFLGFRGLLKYFNTISYQEKQIQFLPESDLVRQRIFAIKRILPSNSSPVADAAFFSEDTVFVLDTGTAYSVELVPNNRAFKAQEIVVKIPVSPIQFTLAGATYPNKILTKTLEVKLIMLGIDFFKRVGSLTITNNKIYLNTIRYDEEKRLACRLSTIEVYKDSSLFVKDYRAPMAPGAKAIYVLGPALPELVLESHS